MVREISGPVSGDWLNLCSDGRATGRSMFASTSHAAEPRSLAEATGCAG